MEDVHQTFLDRDKLAERFLSAEWYDLYQEVTDEEGNKERMDGPLPEL
jgi:hypothetical protein